MEIYGLCHIVELVSSFMSIMVFSGKPTVLKLLDET